MSCAHGASRPPLCAHLEARSVLEMSRRPPEAEEHIRVRGTMVSTFPSHPSKLPVTCVRDWGMPNRNGIVTVDRVVLHIEYDRTDTNLILVYARKPDPPRPSAGYSYDDEPSICSIV